MQWHAVVIGERHILEGETPPHCQAAACFLAKPREPCFWRYMARGIINAGQPRPTSSSSPLTTSSEALRV